MAKTFKDKMQQKAVNPTMQFISQAEEPEQAEPLPFTPIKGESPELRDKPKASRGSSKRKATPPPPPAHRAQPQYGEEAKSRRLQLLITPSLYEAVKARAAEERRSVNDFINAALWDTIRK